MIQKFTIALVYGRLLYCMILKSALISCWLPLLTTARVKWTAKNISPTKLTLIHTVQKQSKRINIAMENTTISYAKSYVRYAVSFSLTLFSPKRRVVLNLLCSVSLIWICRILRVVLLVYLYVNIGILVALIRQPSRGECVK